MRNAKLKPNPEQRTGIGMKLKRKMIMKINTQTAQQFLDAVNDYISNGDWVIAAITPEEAGGMSRKEMNVFLVELMGFVVESSWKS